MISKLLRIRAIPFNYSKTINNGLRFQSTLNSKDIIKPIKNINPNTLDLRVGLIKDIKRHENADSLYVSQIQIGTEENNIVQVCSGLVGLVPIEELHGRRIIVVNNLKPSKMRGVKSEAMLLCADSGVPEGSGPEIKPKVEPISPPEASDIGNVLEFVHIDNKSEEKDNQVKEKKRIKSKAFQEISDDLKINDKLSVVWRQNWLLCDKKLVINEDNNNIDNNNSCKVKDPSLIGAQVR